MKNATLKKRVMATLVAATMVAGTAGAVAPSASAAPSVSANSLLTVSAYQRLSESDLAVYNSQMRHNPANNELELLGTQWGNGWCIDWGLDNPWNNSGGYEVRKLTGLSGRYGTGYGIDENIRIAAINVTKKLMAEYNGRRSASEIKYYKEVLRALLSNNLTSLNESRAPFKSTTTGPTDARFTELTGFTIAYGKAGNGQPNYVLVPNQDRLNQIRQTVGPNEYVTILVPRNYDWSMTFKRNVTFQRIITVVQPGLPDPNKPPTQTTTTPAVPTPGQTITDTVTVTKPAVPTTVTETLPPVVTQTVVTETPRVVTSTITYPATTVTERTTLPTAYTTTKVTNPPKTVTQTVPAAPVTKTTVVTENQTPVTKTITTTPTAVVTTVTEQGTPTTVTETITDTPVTKTVTPSTVTSTFTTTPKQTIETTIPGTTAVVTKTVTPAPQTTVTTIPYTENYYTEKFYESVKEVYEYYYFAGFTREENSKIIELPGSIGGSWTFEIIKGQDIVTVERTEDGKLVITPKPGFSGEGDVEILITDDQGNQHIYRVRVTDTVNVETLTKVKVNNFFYTINPGSENRVKIIEKEKNQKAEWIFVGPDGKEFTPKSGQIEVKDDETKVTVEVKDPSFRGNVVVQIKEDNQVVRENIVTIEDTTSHFDVVREILNTSTALIEYRGGSQKIIKGEDLVESIEVKDGNWVVKPKPDSTGDVVIVFTDENGIDYKYTLKITEDTNSSPIIRESDVVEGDKVEIDRKDGWSIDVVSGEADITDTKGSWTVVPTKVGDVVLHIKDKDGVLIGIWTIHTAPELNDLTQIKYEERTREVVDRTTVDLYVGFNGSNDPENPNPDKSNWFELEDKDGIVDRTKSSLPGEGGDTANRGKPWRLKFQPGKSGEVVVTEYQWSYDQNGNKTPKAITKYIYKVTQAPVRELNYTVTTDHIIDLAGTELTVIEGKNNKMIAGDLPKDGAEKLSLELQRTAQGQIVVENRTEDGYLFERYTINVTPRKEPKPVTREMSWAETGRISVYPEDSFRVVTGNDLVNVTREGDTLVITGNKGKTGKAVVEVSDHRGVYSKYEFTIVSPKENQRVYNMKIATNSAFIATLVNSENRFEMIQGADFFNAPVEEKATNGEPAQWTLRPKESGVGNTGVVVEYNKQGVEINRYILEIVEGPKRVEQQQNAAVPVDQQIDFPAMKRGKHFTIVDGAEYVTTETTGANGTFRVIPKDGTVGKRVVIEERDEKFNLQRTIYLEILEAGAPFDVKNQQTTGGNKDLPGVTIDNRTTSGPVNITLPEGTDMVITEGADKVKVEGTKTEQGRVIVPTDPNVKNIKYVLVESGTGMQSLDERVLEINVEVNAANQNQNGAKGTQKRELSGECIAGIVGLTAPLLLAIPVAILSQVQIPGLEGLSAQVNAAIKQANDQIQRGLGIYDEDRAQRAAGIQGAFQIANPEMIGLAVGALGVITAGLLIIDQVMHACGASEYTSSYAVGKGSNNERLMYGSSGQGKNYAEEKAAKPSTSEAKPSEAKAADTQ